MHQYDEMLNDFECCFQIRLNIVFALQAARKAGHDLYIHILSLELARGKKFIGSNIYIHSL